MLGAADGLATFPRLHKRVPEWKDDAVRQTIVYSYRLIFRVCDEAIEVLAVIHGARLLPDEIRERR